MTKKINKINEVAIQRVIKRTIALIDEYVHVPIELKAALTLENHKITKTVKDKHTIVELEFVWDGYRHHFFGHAVKNPKDEDSAEGEKLALGKAVVSLIKTITFRIHEKELKENDRSTKIKSIEFSKILDLFDEEFIYDNR